MGRLSADWKLSRRSVSSLLFAAMVSTSALPAASWAQDAAVPEINIATGSGAAAFGPIWIALGDKLFEKHNVKVNVVNYNAQTTGSAMMVAGQIDIFAHTPMGGIRISQQGKPVRYLMALADKTALFNTVVAKKEIADMAQLQALGENCRWATTPPGSGISAITVAYMRAFELKCTVDIVSNAPMAVAGVASSQYDVAAVLTQDGYSLAEQGRANLLLDPAKLSTEELNRIYPYNHPSLVISGMKDNLEFKREGVERFMGAMREAVERLGSMTPQQAAEVHSRVTEAVGSIPMASLIAQWELTLPAIPKGAEAGLISESDWNDLLEAGPIFWNASELKGDEAASYANMVDMSYFTSAK